MAKSIIQQSKNCYACELLGIYNDRNLEEHHLYFGNPNRQLSEKYGLKVWLCIDHHKGNDGVHFNRELDLKLKKIGQRYFETTHGTRDDFLNVFGRNYL